MLAHLVTTLRVMPYSFCFQPISVFLMEAIGAYGGEQDKLAIISTVPLANKYRNILLL